MVSDVLYTTIEVKMTGSTKYLGGIFTGKLETEVTLHFDKPVTADQALRAAADVANAGDGTR